MSLTQLPTRSVGSLTVGAQGLGCMGMTDSPRPADRAEATATIQRAIELGANLLDTADVYGHGASEELVGRAIARRRDAAVVATKFGVVRPPGPGMGTGIRGDAAYVRQACEASLRRLGTDYIDLFYLTRVDTSVDIEETVGALSDLVAEGKVREIGLSEAGPKTIRRAHAVAPVAALETEWSLWSRDIEAEIAGVCRDLGIAVVAYAPIGHGFLSGTIRAADQLPADDFRRAGLPRFAPENLTANLALADQLAQLAGSLRVSTAQLALAWLHRQGADVIPIPGSTNRAHLEENVDAVFLELTEADLAAVEAAVPAARVRGARWSEFSMSFIGN